MSQERINVGDKVIDFAFLGNTQIFPNVAFSEPSPTPTPTPSPTPPARTVDLQGISINGSVATFSGYVTGNDLIQKGFDVANNISFTGKISSNDGSTSNTTWQHNFTLNGPTFYARAYATFSGIGTIYSATTGPFHCP